MISDSDYERLAEQVAKILSRPSMYVQGADLFNAVVDYISGFAYAVGDPALSEFQRWVSVRYGRADSPVTWSGIVRDATEMSGEEPCAQLRMDLVEFVAFLK